MASLTLRKPSDTAPRDIVIRARENLQASKKPFDIKEWKPLFDPKGELSDQKMPSDDR